MSNKNVKLSVDCRKQKDNRQQEAIKMIKDFLSTLITKLDLERSSKADHGDSPYIGIMSQNSHEIYEINRYHTDCDSSLFFIINEMLETNNIKFDNNFSINLISNRNLYNWVKILTIIKVINECNSNCHEDINRVVDQLRNYFKESSNEIIETEKNETKNSEYFIDYIKDIRESYRF